MKNLEQGYLDEIFLSIACHLTTLHSGSDLSPPDESGVRVRQDNTNEDWDGERVTLVTPQRARLRHTKPICEIDTPENIVCRLVRRPHRHLSLAAARA